MIYETSTMLLSFLPASVQVQGPTRAEPAIALPTCTVTIEVRAQPLGWTRAFEPIMKLAMPRRGARISDDLVALIESRDR